MIHKQNPDGMADILSQFDMTFEEQESQESEAITEALLSVAQVCDGAKSKDGEGFNRDDYRRGHELADIATWGTLSAIEEKEAKGLLRKYKRQIPEEVYQKLYGRR